MSCISPVEKVRHPLDSQPITHPLDMNNSGDVAAINVRSAYCLISDVTPKDEAQIKVHIHSYCSRKS